MLVYAQYKSTSLWPHTPHIRLGLTNKESKETTNILWDANKPAKLQAFFWQINFEGFFTRS